MKQVRSTSKKLGQLLVERGWATGDQILRAVRSQRTLGGRLGTCLLELDVVEEDRLVEALAEQQGAPAAAVENLRAIPEEVVGLLPSKVARRCLAVPFSATDREVDVATLDAKDMALIDELTFCTSRKVRTHVVSEVRIHEALARYYGVECPRRFAQLVDRLNRSRFLWKKRSEPKAAPEPEAAFGFGDDSIRIAWRDPDEVFDRPGELPLAAPPAPASGPEPASGPTLDASGVARLLKRAARAGDVGLAVARFLEARFDRYALLQIRGSHVAPWRGHGRKLDARRFRELRIRLSEPSVFLDLGRGREEYHLGPLAPLPPHRMLVRCWRESWPVACYVAPVRVGRKTAAFLYGDRVSDPLADLSVEELRSVASLAGDALGHWIQSTKLQAN